MIATRTHEVTKMLLLHENETSSLNGKHKIVEGLPLAKATISDFLGRKFPPRRTVEWATANDDEITAWTSADRWGFVVYREPRLLHERAAVGAIIDYPFLKIHQPEMARQLLSTGIADLQSYGCTNVFMELPVDAHSPRAVAESVGFEFVGIKENPARRVYQRGLQPAQPRRSLFPYAGSAQVRSAATAGDAPAPDLAFWQHATLYSGFSAYPVIDQFLDLIVPVDCRRFLSVPCATGDAVRFFPPRRHIEEIVGVDINPPAVQFANLRLRYPWLDDVNKNLLASLATGGSNGAAARATDFVSAVAAALGCESFDVDDVFEQLKAAWKFGVHNAAVADYWLLFKGLVELVASTSKAHPLVALQDVVTVPEVSARLNRFAASSLEHDYSRPNGNHRQSPRITIECADFLETQAGIFDCIFAFEAFLMFFAAGRQGEFIDALVNHLDRPGRLVLTGIRNSGELPTELAWAREELARRGLQIRVGMFRPNTADMDESTQAYPFLIAER